MQFVEDILTSKEKDNILENFRPYKDKKSIVEEQNIEKNYKNQKKKFLNTENHVKIACQDIFFWINFFQTSNQYF